MWVGFIASGAIAIFTTPQLINLIKTRNTTHINIPMYAIYLVGCFLFLIGGICMVLGYGIGKDKSIGKCLSSGLPLIIAQSICGLISSVIFGWKLKNYFRAKKANVTETQYCKQLKSIYDEYKHKIRSLSHKDEQTVKVVEEK
ncbi:MAG: hypothetical protein LBP70_02525 [Mycoplasmataceae bacterium]|nr:hypothetical protein [Mycoplasmataceae bacterium]